MVNRDGICPAIVSCLDLNKGPVLVEKEQSWQLFT